MALQTLTEAARNGTLRKHLTKYIKYCQCPDGNDSQTPPGSNRRPRRLFPNLAGFCFWMECGFSAFHELQATYPDEADMILCAMEDQALNAYYLKVSVLIAYLRNRLDYDFPKKRSGSRSRTKDRDRPCKIEIYSATDDEPLCNNNDPNSTAAQAPEPLPDPTSDESPREQTPRPAPHKRIAPPPPYSVYRIRHTAKRSTSAPLPCRALRSRPPPPAKTNQPPEQHTYCPSGRSSLIENRIN